ncbi:amino acid ABC transporter permease [Oceaniglobus indicus]|uniref:amino acid ABC transporter permease n=1 Tax=Oceaniglobus indicus TaxID=2047749 RepID=UPI000C17CBF6|nr:ABC transporter permease subunit [Oceaniglobus indicus]
MSAMTDPPRPSFRLSQLIYDTRYRSITIQVVALVLLCAAFWWLIDNTVENLAVLGKDFDFGFLGDRAGYDINQMLIPYDNSMSHGRAALVGILNTMLVAFLGCVTATVIGVFAGVLRLSKNWVVSRLMAVYVEGFRNVPLLLWIVLIFALMTEATPQPRDFREGGSASMILGDSVAITNRGVFLPMPTWGDGAAVLGLVVVLSLIGAYLYRRHARKVLYDSGRLLPMVWPALAIAIVPAVVVYFAFAMSTGSAQVRLMAADATEGQSVAAYGEAQGSLSVCVPEGTIGLNVQRLLRGQDLRYSESVFATEAMAIDAFRNGDCNMVAVPAGMEQPLLGNPDIAVSALSESTTRGAPVQFEKPVLGGFNFEGGVQVRNSLLALWLALALYTGAFIAEIVRAGILAVSKGQSEAAFALGMRPNRTMNLVILPQAMRVIVPPLISQFLNLTKNSSLAIAVGYMDVRATLGGISINQTGRELEGMLLLGMFYLALSLVISGAMNIYNNRSRLKER